ncbi:hypothetical protein AB0G02_38970 [Actinosynnema sp. NPDC023658]
MAGEGEVTDVGAVAVVQFVDDERGWAGLGAAPARKVSSRSARPGGP